ncbi:tRNA pseudouridine(13) synthase TruD [Candidatus Bathyarchaeota archaeon]|nr:tRNA pseudouridine(13) synthase TruD [Candidatus Bathyarchaeota archaeon]MBT4320013.1 tRNA pseudouridine(13) synthase TruD [Candidatus Bathyarchaeota archaeon]MBT4423848.1 tRNA pseudouridine(13) synthase TruD [Candidatus Bathyarchaeota archaeon]MBT7186410.1 tRNA pseudouridine(13) synthase TruD [Candidatus Bathyarchaeota archaeon]
MVPEFNLQLPLISEDLPGIGGRIRARIDDFVVEEISSIEPSGRGTHLYMNITKEGMTTREVQMQLVELFHLRPQMIGTGGLKDKDARATQVFSLQLEKEKIDTEKAVRSVAGSIDVRVNWAKYHDTKFRAGHLIGNSFKVLISDIKVSRGKALHRVNRITDRIHSIGIPNFYGEQRMGRRGKNAKAGWDILHGEKNVGNRWLSRYLISAYQSHLCNRYLAERVERDIYDRLVPGDIIEDHGTGERTLIHEPGDLQQRYLNGEISFTAPMFGPKMIRASREAGILEAEIYAESGLSNKLLKRNRVTGTRRRGRLTPRIEIEAKKRGIQLSFTLHKGGFATTLLREFMKTSHGQR